MLIVFVISRVLYDRAGIHFQGDTYLGYWQFIDPELLRTDLWRSVFYLHSQPPLTNLLTGIVLQIFPVGHEEVFHILYFMIGIILAISIYSAWESPCVFRPGFQRLISAWFMVSPGTVLYEHWLAYAYPLTAALTLSGFCLYQFIRTEKELLGTDILYTTQRHCADLEPVSHCVAVWHRRPIIHCACRTQKSSPRRFSARAFGDSMVRKKPPHCWRIYRQFMGGDEHLKDRHIPYS